MVTSGNRDPGSGQPRSRIAHYMVGGTDSELLSRIAAELGAEQGITVSTISGTPDRPSILAVSMPRERAARLRDQYRERIIIEPDQPLEHYDSGG